jgi:anaerobic magnesium-protoporphyrin IX monomethyl ester cyclase
MRVLLINPFYPISETPSPPLGLAYLAAALEEAGVDVRVLDLVVFPYSEDMLATLLDEFKPALVGLTAVTMNVDRALSVVRDVKRLAPHVVTVLGGPHVTFSPSETLEACPSLDIVALGEGERTIVELSAAIEAGAGVTGVKGIAYRNGTTLRCTPRRGFIRNLDALPLPARRLLPLGRYRALGMPISMTTSRGCPHGCIFCIGRRMVGSRVRFRSPAKVADELASVAALGFHQVNLADDLFTADPGRCIAICDEILRRGLSIKWTSFARVDTVSPGLLIKMKAAGCTAISFGIESGNSGILRSIRKGITLEQVVAAVDMCADAGLTPFASFILGLPGETPDTLRETIAFGQRLEKRGLVYGFHLLAPFPGTEVRERSGQLGIRILSNDWSCYHANRAVAETRTVTRQMLDEIAVAWEDRFNRYLGDIRDRMPAGKADADEIYQLTNLERIVLVYDLMMNDTLAQVGTWPDGPQMNPGECLKTLVRRVEAAAPHGRERIRDALETAAGKGNLICVQTNGTVRWKWKDYL